MIDPAIFKDIERNPYRLEIYRLEPQTLKGHRINGHLMTLYMPTTVPDIYSSTGMMFGGGKYQVRVMDADGTYLKSCCFEIAGLPQTKTPEEMRLIQILLDYYKEKPGIKVEDWERATSMSELSDEDINYVISRVPKEDWTTILPMLPSHLAKDWAEELRAYYSDSNKR